MCSAELRKGKRVLVRGTITPLSLIFEHKAVNSKHFFDWSSRTPCSVDQILCQSDMDFPCCVLATSGNTHNGSRDFSEAILRIVERTTIF